MKNNFLPILLFLCLTITIKAIENDTLYYNDNYSVKIDSILIRGNDQTADFIILRELTIGIGDTLNPGIARYNRERIYSLDIFNEVKLIPFKTNNKNYLLILIEESWYIYPLPFVTVREKDWNKISYGIAVKVKNFRGRNESLIGKFALGYDPSFSFSYFNPYLSRELDMYSQIQFGFTDVANKSFTAEKIAGKDFNQKWYYGKIIIGKRLGLYNWISISAGYDYIETPFYNDKISASNERIDRTVILGFNYSYDTRDLIQYASNGIFAFVNYELKGMGINDINYKVATFEFREYRKLIGNLVGKWLIATRLTNGKVPLYDYSYLGLNQRIRGHWDEQMEGNNLFMGSLEFNYWILNDTRLNMYWIPFLPKSLLSYRVGLVWELFVDTGTTSINGDSLTLKQFTTGYGTGFSILFLPYFSARLEFAVDNNFRGQWIFDLGASF
jgi:outer membrane protein assembly factor BamA